MALVRPPANLHSLRLSTTVVHVSRLYRVSRHNSGEPFFGRTGANRFDSPQAGPLTRRYGTCYLGFDLRTAVAETVLHDLVPVGNVYQVSRADFNSRYLVRFAGASLRLAVMYGPALKVLAGDGSLSTVMPYDLPQEWSAAIHGHPQNVDGIIYMSRHLNDRKAVVVFDRAAGSFTSAAYIELPRARGVAHAITTLGIDLSFP